MIQPLRLLQEYSSCLGSTRLRKPHQLLVLALFKNESHVLAEWVEHYLAEGATAIHLINNNSTDDFLSPLQDFIASGVVTLHHDSRQHCQRQIYNEHLQHLRSQCRWQYWSAIWMNSSTREGLGCASAMCSMPNPWR